MRFQLLGNSGLRVLEMCLGTLRFIPSCPMAGWTVQRRSLSTRPMSRPGE